MGKRNRFLEVLDVYPDFEKYIAAFETFGNLVLGVFNAGGAELLHAIDAQGMEALLKDGDRKAQDMIKEDMELLDEETREKDYIQEEMNDTSKKMAQTRLQIVAVEEEMRHHDITIGDIFRVAEKVADIAGAVGHDGGSFRRHESAGLDT